MGQLRGFWVRKELKQKSNAAVLLQAFTRGMLARKRTEKIRDEVRSRCDEPVREISPLTL